MGDQLTMQMRVGQIRKDQIRSDQPPVGAGGLGDQEPELCAGAGTIPVVGARGYMLPRGMRPPFVRS